MHFRSGANLQTSAWSFSTKVKQIFVWCSMHAAFIHGIVHYSIVSLAYITLNSFVYMRVYMHAHDDGQFAKCFGELFLLHTLLPMQ